MSRRGNKKSRKQDETLKVIILITAIAQLINTIIEMIEKLIE